MADDKPSPETPSSSSQPSFSESTQHSQVSTHSSFAAFPAAYYQMLYPPAPAPPLQNQEPVNRGAGIYAVSVNPYNRLPYNTLIPFTCTTPTRPSSEAATDGENQGQAAQQQQPQQQQPTPQTQVVRRFHFQIKMDQGRGFLSLCYLLRLYIYTKLEL